MDKIRFTLPAVDAVTISFEDADKLLATQDGDAVLLYFYILRAGGEIDPGSAVAALHLSNAELFTAFSKLYACGLLCDEETNAGTADVAAKASAVIQPVQELPQYQAQDVAGYDMDDQPFRDLVQDVQQILGRIITSEELKKLFGIYNDLSLPAEEICLLFQYCKDETMAHYGPGRMVNFSYIVKVAYSWFNNGLLTREQAQQWVETQDQRRSVIGALEKTLNIASYAPTIHKFLNDWLDLGFSSDAILEAADRSSIQTGEIQWRYMDGIIQSWHQKGLHTIEEIQAGDTKPDRPSRYVQAEQPASEPGENMGTMERLTRLRDKIQNS